MAVSPKIGDPAPDFALPATTGETVSLRDYYGEPVLLVFLEQLGSMLGREHVRELARRRAQLEGASAAVLVISFAPIERLRSFAGELGLPFPCLSDPEMEIYRTYALGQAALERVLSVRTMLALFKLMMQGRRLPRTEGDPLQLGGNFVVGREGRLRLTHRMSEPLDRPRIADLVRLLGEVALAGRLE